MIFRKNGKAPKAKRRKKDENSEPENMYEVAVGQTVWVTAIGVEDPNMRRRLQDLGIICGTRVLCKQKAPSGNPKSYLVRGATVAIRRDVSELISVTCTPPEYAETD
ncbi:MAG: ferrous iron transport protein A [Clostridia bacterium]|nr:ferrous iron transport protein A [Clostridia bacterium]